MLLLFNVKSAIYKKKKITVLLSLFKNSTPGEWSRIRPRIWNQWNKCLWGTMEQIPALLGGNTARIYSSPHKGPENTHQSQAQCSLLASSFSYCFWCGVWHILALWTGKADTTWKCSVQWISANWLVVVPVLGHLLMLERLIKVFVNLAQFCFQQKPKSTPKNFLEDDDVLILVWW